MKLSFGLAAALAGCAAAAQQAADVYILPSASESTSSTTSIPRSLARLVLLQRLAAPGQGPSINEIPDEVDAETVVDVMNEFGKEPPSLFDAGDSLPPSQLVVMLEGLTAEQMEVFENAFQSKPAFTITDPPSAKAHEKLVKYDIYNVGVTNEHKCSIKEVTNPFTEKCWSGQSTVAKYNVQKYPDVIADLSRQIPSLARLANSGEMETTVVLLPPDTDNVAAKSWSDKPQELRRRQAEQVISSLDKPEPESSSEPTSSAAEGNVFVGAAKVKPGCFTSKDSCASSTGNCSGHGECVNKYAKPDGSEGKESCYVCHCLSTKSDAGSVTHWAGPACSKKDISVSFWLFAGFTLFMVGIVTFSISLLFNVGEEKLPGVIGAGVSRSK